MKSLIVFIVVVLMSGCVGSGAWESMQISATRDEAKRNNVKFMNVEIGQSKQEILQIMGVPAKREAYQLSNEKIIEFLFYRTDGWSNAYPSDNDSQFTPVAVENGKVKGWGRNYYDRIVRAAVDVTIK